MTASARQHLPRSVRVAADEVRSSTTGAMRPRMADLPAARSFVGRAGVFSAQRRGLRDLRQKRHFTVEATSVLSDSLRAQRVCISADE